MFIAIKTDGGRIKGEIPFYCRASHVSRQAFSKCLKAKDAPWKCQALADAMIDICSEGGCNGAYGRIRMCQALQPKQPEGAHIPGGGLFTVPWEKLALTISRGASLTALRKLIKKPVNQVV